MRLVETWGSRDIFGIRGEEENRVAHQNRLFNVVRYHQHRFGRQLMLDPEVEEVGAQGFSRQNVECRKRLVHKKQDRITGRRIGLCRLWAPQPNLPK